MSAVQFNLLPDVKLEYIKAQTSRSLATSIAVLATAVAIAILIIMLFTAEVIQKKQLSDAETSVTTASKQLTGITGLGQVLTVQNQLATLSKLHANKHITSRIFTYLPEITPSNVQITEANLDLTSNSLTVSGMAASQLAVNTFIDTLEFTNYKANAQNSEHPAFTSVIESAFALTDNGATYTITAQFDPALFANSNQQTPQIILHNQVTTRSVLNDPSNVLFSGQTNSTKSGGQ
ncbi:MAG: PilN domain-containing protein [Candidatus Saccharimonadales bacterium]|jgi:Tfp pilus assembly protein PilN